LARFEFNKKTGWLLRPGTITVYLHDVIETKIFAKKMSWRFATAYMNYFASD